MGAASSQAPVCFLWAIGEAFNQLKHPEPENMSQSELRESHAALSLAEEVENGQRVYH